MPSDEERLVILLEARIRDLEKNMAKAVGLTGKAYREMSRGSKSATRQMEADMIRATSRINQALAATSARIGSFGKAFIGGFVGGIAAGGIGELVSRIGDVAKGVAEVGDRAKQAGLDVKAFQELAFVAQQNRIEVDDLTSGIREMQLRFDEFIASGGKSGSAADSLRRLGYTVDDLKEKLKDPLDLFTEIIGKVQQLDRAGQIRVFDEIFGGDGERLVRLISEGEQGIRNQIKAANDLGLVLDEQVIARAEEVDRKFQAITATVGTGLKAAIVDAASALGGFIDSFRDFQNQQTRTLQGELEDVYRKMDATKTEIQDLNTMGGVLPNPFNTSNIKDAEGRLKSLTDQAAKLRDILDRRQGFSEDFTYKPTTALPPVSVAAPGSAGGKKSTSGGGGRASETSAINYQRDAVRALIADLESERSLIGATDVERAKANALRQAGAAATAAEKAQIGDLVEAMYAEQTALDQRNQQLEEMNAIGRDFVGGFIHDMKNGSSAADAFANAVSRLSDRIIDDLLDSIFKVNSASGSGGIFGSLLGSLGGGLSGGGGLGTFAAAAFGTPTFYARGGIANTPSIFGEAGPEAAVPLPDGRRIPVDLRGQGGGQQAVKVDVAVRVDQDGNWQAAVENIAQTQSKNVVTAGIKRYDAELKGSFGKRMNQAQARQL